MPTFGSLFAGIGGMDLGLERSGWECKWQVEIDPFCRRVLAKHWPSVPKHDDVRTFPPDSGDWRVDLIAGGFPCQDISGAGKGAGLDGERSGLWREQFRIIRDLRPRYVVVANSPVLLVRGLDRILGELASLGFDAEWSCLSACSLGAPHTRERLFIVAHSDGLDGEAWLGAGHDRKGQASLQRDRIRERHEHWVESASRAARGADELPGRVDRTRSIGNAVLPEVAEFIGRRLMEAIT